MKSILVNPDDSLSNEHFPNFDEIVPDVALALLLLSESVFMIGVKNEKENEEEPSTFKAGIFVNANDVFYYACGDCEPVPFFELKQYDSYQQFKRLYNLVKDHSSLGTLVWLIERRKMRPLQRFVDRLKSASLWKEEYNSYPSSYD